MARLADDLLPRRGLPCAAEPERMFPVDESGPGRRPNAGERAALAGCTACPVLATCRVAVLEMPVAYGVAGGLTAGRRRELRAARLGRRRMPGEGGVSATVRDTVGRAGPGASWRCS